MSTSFFKSRLKGSKPLLKGKVAPQYMGERAKSAVFIAWSCQSLLDSGFSSLKLQILSNLFKFWGSPRYLTSKVCSIRAWYAVSHILTGEQRKQVNDLYFKRKTAQTHTKQNLKSWLQQWSFPWKSFVLRNNHAHITQNLINFEFGWFHWNVLPSDSWVKCLFDNIEHCVSLQGRWLSD